MYISPTTISPTSSGGSFTINRVELEKISECKFKYWTISTSHSWISISEIYDDWGGIVGDEDKVMSVRLSVTVSSNSSSARTGYIYVNVSSPEGDESGTITVSQAGGSTSISVNKTSASVAGAGGTVSLTYTTSGSGSLSVTSNQSWATVSGSGNTKTITVAKNSSTSSSRSCTITGSFGGKTVTTTITQSASVWEDISISPSSQSISYAGGTFTVEAVCGNDVDGTNYWTVTTSSGCSISATTNSHHRYVGTVTVAANSGSSRTLWVSFNHGSGASGTLYITQKGVSRTTMSGDNKLATRADFNSQMRGSYYGSDTGKVITGYEIKGMSWSDSSYDYVIELNNSGNYTSTNGRCVICSDVVRVNKAK